MSAPEATGAPAGELLAEDVRVGPAKILLDDDRLPPLEELVGQMRTARQSGRPIAVHCVTHVQAALALAGFEDVGPGPGDRMEHGALLNPGQLVQLRRLGLTVVTQPAFVRSRGEQYLEEVDEVDRPDLWRLASLIRAGIPVAAGTDAPYGPADPWVAVESARERRSDLGRPLGPEESLPDAVTLFHGRPEAPAAVRSVQPGQPADLCVVADGEVQATVIGARVVYRAG
jgi:predicted amidohydrolase YtcJ